MFKLNQAFFYLLDLNISLKLLSMIRIYIKCFKIEDFSIFLAANLKFYSINTQNGSRLNPDKLNQP